MRAVVSVRYRVVLSRFRTMVFMVILRCYGLHIDVGALVVLILFGLCGGRY